ncbi:MAG: geranylgeranyl reductase family protein [Pseudomonadota bacterium]
MVTNSDVQVDIVVIGAGPAGSAAAVSALSSRASVAIIDKASFPRDKLCGGLITGRCARLIKDVFAREIDHELFDTRGTFEFFMGSTCLAKMRDVPPAHLTMRWDFDNQLFQQALTQGAHDYSGHRIKSLNLEKSNVVLECGTSLRFGCLIGADGVRSRVAEALFGQSYEPSQIGFALEIEDSSQPSDPDAPIRVDFGAAAWGYGWSFPKRHGTTIGVGGLHPENPDLKAKLAQYADHLGRNTKAKVKGHFLPFGGFRNRPGRDNVLLVGDAAGFVDPITGEGIGYAIQSGGLAGRAAAEAVAAGKPEKAFARYQPATRRIRISLWCARALRPVMFMPRLQTFFKSAFKSSRTLKTDYMRLLAGEVEYPQLMLRASLRLPFAAMRFALRKSARSERKTHGQRTR